MQQLFHTRNYIIRDFDEWNAKGELVLAPKFQRRDVWNPKARSYLIDTILRGKPIPKIYMRQDINSTTRRTTREVVDGQQRLNTVLNFLKDGFKISKAHSEKHGGRHFSELDEATQKDILKYEFVVDLLQDMPDNEVYDLFARINTYSERLKPQELRNAKFFGEFKSAVYSLSRQTVSFFETNKIFTSKQILRMAEAEFVSDLLLALREGIREGKKDIIDSAYARLDDKFDGRRALERRFLEVVDTIGAIWGADLGQTWCSSTRLFYPMFCSLAHFRYPLPRLKAPRIQLKPSHWQR